MKSASGKKLSASAKKLLLKASRVSSAKKAKAAKTAPNASRKNSAMKNTPVRSVLAKRVGASRP